MDLAHINIENGVNEQGQPFLSVTAISTKGEMMLGQLSPDEVRNHALAYLEAAEAAEQDAAVLRVVRNLGLPDEMAGAVIIELRNSRGT